MASTTTHGTQRQRASVASHACSSSWRQAGSGLGAEAVAEYAGRVSQSAALLFEGSASPYATVTRRLRDGYATVTRRLRDGYATVTRRLAAARTRSPKRTEWLHANAHHGADEEAEEDGRAIHSGSFSARDGALRALVCAAADAALVISESLRSILVHVDHLAEYAATLRHCLLTPETAPATLRHSMPTPEAAASLGGSERCPGRIERCPGRNERCPERSGAAGRETSGVPSSNSSGKRAPKRVKAEALSGGGGSAHYSAATLEALIRFTRHDLQSAPARALSRALAAAASAAAAAAPGAVPGVSPSAVLGARLANGSGGGGGGVATYAAASAALLLPVLPALLEWIALSCLPFSSGLPRRTRSSRRRREHMHAGRSPSSDVLPPRAAAEAASASAASSSAAAFSATSPAASSSTSSAAASLQSATRATHATVCSIRRSPRRPTSPPCAP